MSYRPIGGRRNRSAAWQWGLIGFIPGLFCGVIVMVGIIAQGTLTEFFLPTPEPQVVTTVVHVVMTATEDPNMPTVTPLSQYIVITATPDPAGGGNETSVVAAPPAAVPATSNDVESVQVQPTAIPSEAPTGIPAPTLVPTSEIPEVLKLIRSRTVTVPGGTFTMGTTTGEVATAVNECITIHAGACQAADAQDSFPDHQVTVDSFLQESTEVTFDQYIAFLNVRGPDSHRIGCAGDPCIQTQNESLDAPIIFDGSNYSVNAALAPHPVYGVTWFGAREYCEAVGRRLPTEAEWERAARADDGRIYPWGNRWDNALAKTSRHEEPGSFPVGSYVGGVSQYGAYDMAGNVAEWVSDWYSERYYQEQKNLGVSVNPSGPVAGLDKVLRGGSWDGAPFFSRSVHRQAADPASTLRWIGFRCVADPPNANVIGSSDLNPATLGQNVPAAPPQNTAIPNSQPTQPPPPEANRADDTSTSNSAG